MAATIFITALIGLCLVLSFLFSGMEAGVLALSRLRIRQLMRTGNPRAVVLNQFLERPENFLWTILIGNTLANFIAIGFIVALLYGWLGAQPGFLLLSFLVDDDDADLRNGTPHFAELAAAADSRKIPRPPDPPPRPGGPTPSPPR